MGLKVTCARCHDHPTDPIPTADYYRLAAALAGTRHPVPNTKQKSYSVVSKKPEVMHVFHRGDDTFCDDGSTFIHLNCAEFSFDGGDC